MSMYEASKQCGHTFSVSIDVSASAEGQEARL